MEIELKLALQPQDAARLRRNEVLKQAAGKALRQKLYSIYFDTPALDLLKAGMALRVRKVGRQWIQTAKGGGAVVAGLHQRAEWECRVNGRQPDLQQLPPEVLALLSAEQWQQIVPVFTSDFWRTIWNLDIAGGSVEMALDQGQVVSGDNSMPISEVELELKQGEAGILFKVAKTLLHAVPLKLDSVSKAERGYALYSALEPAPTRAERPSLQPKMSVVDGFAALLASCLQQLQKNGQYLDRHCDIEYLHQMRVAVRRFYAALHLLRKETKIKSWQRLQEDLRWLMKKMSPVRDLDVFVQETLPAARGLVPESILQRLQQAAEAVRQESQQALFEALASPRYQLFLLDAAAMLLNPPILSRYRKNRLEPVLHRPLDGWHKKLLSGLRNLHSLSAEQRHRLRIRAKRLRYAAEFASVLYPQNRWKAYRNGLAQVQDTLGKAQDRVVAKRFLDLLGERDPSLNNEIAQFAAWLDSCEADVLNSKRLAGEFGKLKPFWQ